jgi:uncharacterized protein (DUF427 family)
VWGHRVTTHRASAHVVVRSGGEVIADTRRPVVLHETGLPDRYYLPRDDVRMDLLVPTSHHTTCPFKGEASYWTVKAGDTEVENAVWCYEDPIDGVEEIRGLLCFYPDKVDLEIGA